jgi:hypothetical protein
MKIPREQAIEMIKTAEVTFNSGGCFYLIEDNLKVWEGKGWIEQSEIEKAEIELRNCPVFFDSEGRAKKFNQYMDRSDKLIRLLQKKIKELKDELARK